jgi:phytoene dehydrogenase-like protein
VVKVMLLLDGLPDFPAWPGPEPWAGTIDVGYSLEDLAAAADAARAGRPAETIWMEASCQTAADPTRAPGDRHVLSMFCQCFPADADAEAAADAAIARLALTCPELPRRIVDRLALGPRELEARIRHSPAGTSSTARCCPARCSRTASGPATSPASAAFTSPARAPIRAVR